MGLRLSFGIGPLRASVPLTSRRRRRRRAAARQTFHAVVTFTDGSVYNCPHQHHTEQAAAECAQKYRRAVAAGRPVPPPAQPKRR